MYAPVFRQHVQRSIDCLVLRDPATARQLLKKICEICRDPHHYKNLRSPLHRYKRVHIRGCFVLVFSVDERLKTVTFEDLDHHDRIYKK